MRLLIYSENDYGCGASIAAYRLAAGMAKSHEVMYVFENQKNDYSLYKNTGIRPWHLGRTYSFAKKAIYKSARLIAKFTRGETYRNLIFSVFLSRVKQYNPDIIHLHNCYFTQKQIARLAELFPVVWTMHDQFALYGYNYRITALDGEDVTYCPVAAWRRKLYNPDDLLNSQQAKVIFTPPSDWLSGLAEKITKGRKPVKTVNNGIPLDAMYPVEKAEACEYVGIDPDKFTLLFLAGTGAWKRKNVDAVIQALNMIPELDMQAVVIGSTAKTDRSDPRLVLKGSVTGTDALSRYYSCADVFCIPSIIDNLPNTVLESLACATPVLGSHNGGVPEMVIEGRTGWLFDPMNPGELAEKIKYLYTHREEIKDIQKNCRDFVTEKFGEETMTANYEKIYREMKGD
ncbi:MAG: glycosyltransferase [Deferribacterales bacterium]